MRKTVWAVALLLCWCNIGYADSTSWQWKTADDLQGWKPGNFAHYAASGGALQGLTQYDSQILSPLLHLDAIQWTDLEFRLKSNVGGNGEIFFRHDDEGMSDKRQISFSIAGDNQFHTYRVNLSSHLQWQGTITQIRFDPLNPANAQIEVDYLRFLPKNTGGLIANGGFELNDAKTGLPEDWSFRFAGSKNIIGHHSQHAIQILAGLQPGEMQSSIFEFPNTGKFQFSVDTVNSTLKGCVINFYDVFHQHIKTQPLTLVNEKSPRWGTVKSTFEVPYLTAYGQLTFISFPGLPLSIDNVSLKAIPAEPQSIKPWEERWRAHWIIAPDANLQPAAPRHFRRSFQIIDISSVTSAKVEITADDTARVYMNGHELPAAANWNDWKLIDIYDIKPYLQNGKNVIGIITENQGSAEGLLAELNIQQSGGEIDLNTDKSWRTFIGKANTEWAKSTFDDSSWKAAKELGLPPVAPWHELPYVYLGQKMPLVAKSFASPRQASLGQNIAVHLRVVPQTNTYRPTALKLELTPVNAASHTAPYTFPAIPLDTTKWKKDIEIDLQQNLQMPRFFQPGKYFLTASLTYTSLKKNGVPLQNPLELTLPHAVKPPVSKVIYLPGHIPAFEINGKAFPVMHVMTHPSSLEMNKRIIENSRDNNLNLIWLNVPEGFDWQPNAPASFMKMDKSIASVLESNPRAYIVLNVPLDPVYNPGLRKWNDLHPDQLVQKDDGSTSVGGYHGSVTQSASYASPIWKKDASQAWRELIRHVRSSSYADHVIGYVPISGISWEWFYWGAQSKEFVDYSKPFTQAFRAWLRDQYGDDIVRLNQTWKTTYTTFDEIQLPSKAERSGADKGVFLDPQKRGAVIDLREFFTQVISGDILHFCHIVKEETQGNAICGTYYGYVMYIGGPYFGVHSGHYALGKVLLSPDIDFVMSPSRYADRGLGGGSGFMTVVDSIKLHKKLYIDQADIRTFRATGPGGQLARLNTLKDSVSVLEREFTNTVVNGVASQWYDFGNGWIAGDARLMQAAGKMHQIEKKLQHTTRETMDAKNAIAIITSEKSILYTKVDSTVQSAAVNQEINQLNRSGVAWDAYLLSDLPKLRGYRYYLFLNCYDLTNAQKRYIDANLKKDGNVLVWVGTPGIINRNDKSTFAQAAFDPARVSAVTGFDLKQISDGPLVTVLKGTDGLVKELTGKTFGDSNVTGPRFAPRDGIALGHFSDNAEISLAVKVFPANWTSLYSAAPTLPAALLQNIAAFADVPIINKNVNDITYVSQNLFAVHSLAGGERVFQVESRYQSAQELFSDTSYAVKDGHFSVTVPAGGTLLFLLK